MDFFIELAWDLLILIQGKMARLPIGGEQVGFFNGPSLPEPPGAADKRAGGGWKRAGRDGMRARGRAEKPPPRASFLLNHLQLL